jgi:hypothetical protein
MGTNDFRDLDDVLAYTEVDPVRSIYPCVQCMDLHRPINYQSIPPPLIRQNQGLATHIPRLLIDFGIATCFVSSLSRDKGTKNINHRRTSLQVKHSAARHQHHLHITCPPTLRDVRPNTKFTLMVCPTTPPAAWGSLRITDPAFWRGNAELPIPPTSWMGWV